MRYRLGVALTLCLLSGWGVARAQDTVVQAPAAPPSAEAGLERVRSARLESYRAVLAEFAAAKQAAPDDVALAVDECRYIGQFTDDESGDWIEQAWDDFDRCTAALERQWPKAPQARLFALDQLWGEDAVKFGAPLLAVADAWPEPSRRRLFAMMSRAYATTGNRPRAGELALAAARLGEPSRVGDAVEYLAGKGRFAEAQALLAGSAPATGQWQATDRVSAALALPDRKAARAELLRYRGAEFSVTADVAARAQLRAGDIRAARRLLEQAKGRSPQLQRARFDVALAAADLRGAALLVDMWDADNIAENAQRFALVLHRAPASLLDGPMLRSAVFLLVLLGVLSLACGLLLVPVHYRGALRRLRDRPATPLHDGIGLRHGWLGLCVMVCAPPLAAIALEPHAVAKLFGGDAEMLPGTLFRAMGWGTLLGLLCVLPVAMRGLGWQRLFGDRAALRGAWRILVAWAVLIAVGAVTAWANSQAGDTQTEQTRMIDSLVGGGLQTYGLAATLLLVAGLVPVFEETVFRGFLLGGLTRHISFGWANLAQATLFAAIHDDLPRFPFYFALGLLAGWLVRKTRALGPAMCLHMLNNGLVTLIRHAA